MSKHCDEKVVRGCRVRVSLRTQQFLVQEFVIESSYEANVRWQRPLPHPVVLYVFSGSAQLIVRGRKPVEMSGCEPASVEIPARRGYKVVISSGNCVKFVATHALNQSSPQEQKQPLRGLFE
jgi:hypothetical protein